MIKLVMGKNSRTTPLVTRFFNCVFPEPNSGCWLWVGGLGAKAYGSIRSESGKKIGAHRLSYEMHKGPIPLGMFVRHKCDNPPCVNPDHLEVGTHTDNMCDMYKRQRNRQRKGSSHHKAILDEATVAAIKQTLSEGVTGALLAVKYNVSVSTISLIRRGKIWRHVS